MTQASTGPAFVTRLRRWSHARRARTRSLAFCTIATRDFLPWALTLFDSVRRHHPGAHLALLYVRRENEPAQVPVSDGVKVISPSDLVDATIEAALRRRYGIAELCFSLKAGLLIHVLQHLAERAIYLDSDIDVVGPLDEALIALETASAVLTPHLDVPLPTDHMRPSDLTMLRAGACNAGFAAVARGEEALRMLNWWGGRTMLWGFVAPEFGYQGDQKWLDLVPGLFPGVALLRDPGSNAAYWNLHSRAIALEGARPTANGHPLAFVHFSGFDPDKPEILSKFQNRIREAEQPIVMQLARDFAARLVAARERASRLQWREVPGRPEPPPAGPATFVEGAMPGTAYRASIVVRHYNAMMETREEVTADLTITNASDVPWSVARGKQGAGGIALSWHWRDAERNVARWENRRYFLPRDLAPGESIQLQVSDLAPETPGLYFLEFDLVHEAIGWFGTRGTATALVAVHVGGIFAVPA